ncbi:hypothetical protein VTO73DRAFT_14500, partial [Trametes versicolor]
MAVTGSVWRLLLIGLVFHLVYIGTVFDCYFTSPVVHAHVGLDDVTPPGFRGLLPARAPYLLAQTLCDSVHPVLLLRVRSPEHKITGHAHYNRRFDASERCAVRKNRKTPDGGVPRPCSRSRASTPPRVPSKPTLWTLRNPYECNWCRSCAHESQSAISPPMTSTDTVSASKKAPICVINTLRTADKER